MEKEIVPKDSRYVPFAQQKSCCAPTSISMIMYKNKIPLLPQELLGYHLGLTVEKECKNLFWNSKMVGERPPSGYGTRIVLNKYNPNTVFPKLKIPLKMIYHPISTFNDIDFKKFMVDAVKKDKDVCVCFNHGVLKGERAGNGHVCVLDRIYPSKGLVRIIDPSVNQPKWRIVRISLLKKAMEVHGDDKMGGFWEFKKV
ncbi:MAG: hypothetical protein ACOYS2_03535 [Patescibacteria group bacterium]